MIALAFIIVCHAENESAHFDGMSLVVASVRVDGITIGTDGPCTIEKRVKIGDIDLAFSAALAVQEKHGIVAANFKGVRLPYSDTPAAHPVASNEPHRFTLDLVVALAALRGNRRF